MCEPAVSRGDIYFADLGTGVGSEQGGVRPVVVIQNNVGNRHSSTIIVAPLTARQKKALPTHVAIECDGLHSTSYVLLEQIRTIDKSRLMEHLCTISGEQLHRINIATSISLGLEEPYGN